MKARKSFSDVVGGEEWAVGTEEGEGRFEAAGHADGGDYDWFLGMCVSKLTEKKLGESGQDERTSKRLICWRLFFEGGIHPRVSSSTNTSASWICSELMGSACSRLSSSGLYRAS